MQVYIVFIITLVEAIDLYGIISTKNILDTTTVSIVELVSLTEELPSLLVLNKFRKQSKARSITKANQLYYQNANSSMIWLLKQ